MRDFLDWLDNKGFWIRNSFDKIDGWSGIDKLKLYPFQRDILGHVFTRNKETDQFPYSTVIYSTIKKSGKPLALDTIIPTPSGYKTMGTIETGDYVFDPDGNSVEVTYVTDVMEGKKCYEIEFANGEKVVASFDHQWEVMDQHKHRVSIKTTEELAQGVESKYTTVGGYSYRVRVSEGISGGLENVPFDPYLFGFWLGDGHSGGAVMTVGEEDVEEVSGYLKERGINPRIRYNEDRSPSILFGEKSGGDISTRTETFGYFIRTSDLENNKHIPVSYLRTSRENRIELLKGLMDSDGYISKEGRCEFCSTNERLALDVRELLATLGVKSKVTEGNAILNGKFVSKKYRIHFTACKDMPVFNLKRKLNRQIEPPTRKRRSHTNSIVSVREVDSVPVRCLMVKSDTHLFCIGRSFIPTHNTTLGAALTCWYAEESPAYSEICLVANDREQTEVLAYADVAFHLEKSGLAVPRKNFAIMENGTKLQAIAQEYKSSAGGRQTFTLWDELWAYQSERSRRLWEEMTLPPTVKYPMKVIVTYAGFQGESELLWDMYEDIVLRGEPVPELEHIKDGDGNPVCFRKGRRFAYWDTVPRLPWQTPEYYAEQASSMRPDQFLRLHRNEWVTSQSAFIPQKYWDRAEKLPAPLASISDSPWRHAPISVGIDISVSGDRAAVVGTYYDTERSKVCLAFDRIWHPSTEHELDPAEIEQYILNMAKTLNVSVCYYDPYQFHRSSIVLQNRGMTMVRFDQTTKNTTAMSQNLFDLFKTKQIEVYPNDELKEHVIYAAAEDKGRGYRIVKNETTRRPVDGAVALAMSAFDSVSKAGVDTSKSIVIQYPESELTTMNLEDVSQKHLPPELRS